MKLRWSWHPADRCSWSRWVAPFVLGLAVLAGCSDGGAHGEVDPLDAPEVTTPLDPADFTDNPCRLVPEEVLRENELSPEGKPNPDYSEDLGKFEKFKAPGCTWNAEGLRVYFVTLRIRDYSDSTYKGIANAYHGKQTGWYHDVRPWQVPGRPGNPAVVAQDLEDESSCKAIVGLTKDLALEFLLLDAHNDVGGCDRTKSLAEAAVKTLVEHHEKSGT